MSFKTFPPSSQQNALLFSAAKAAQEAQMSVRPSVRPFVRPFVRILSL